MAVAKRRRNERVGSERNGTARRAGETQGRAAVKLKQIDETKLTPTALHCTALHGGAAHSTKRTARGAVGVARDRGRGRCSGRMRRETSADGTKRQHTLTATAIGGRGQSMRSVRQCVRYGASDAHATRRNAMRSGAEQWHRRRRWRRRARAAPNAPNANANGQWAVAVRCSGMRARERACDECRA